MERTATHVILTIAEYDALIAMIKKLEQRVSELEAQLNKDSSNSHKPPSSDGYSKEIKNNREKSGKSQGAQEGHKGRTLQMVTHADKIIEHKVKRECKCGKDLSQARVLRIERRQVFDLPEKLLEVTEHQVEVKQCSCGVIHQAECKEKGNAQYGERIKSFAVYMNQYQFLPFERLQEMIRDCFGASMSDGVLSDGNELLFEQLEKSEEQNETPRPRGSRYQTSNNSCPL